MKRCRFVLLLLGSLLAWPLPGSADEPVIQWSRTRLDSTFRSEGVSIADINRDGQQDIVAGYVWYEAPDWTMHSILAETPAYEPKGYSNSFINATDDLNGDGWIDIMIVDFPGTPTWWFENPGESKRPWPRHELTPVSNNESPQYLDVDGDGRREWVMGVNPDRQNPDSETRYLAYLRPASEPNQHWTIHPVSAKSAPGTRKYDHGLGVGDVNGDGRLDFLVPTGWWQAPAEQSGQAWQFHAAPFGEPAAQMYVQDFDGDGDSDVLSSSAHRYGIWWHEQLADHQWRTHEIDTTFSQTHGLIQVDVDGDGLLDFVTGKRWWAHGGNDPGGNEPAVLYWYRFTREGGKPHWTRHLIDRDSGPGTQFEVGDVDGDGLLDVVTSNKKGVHLFLQRR